MLSNWNRLSLMPDYSNILPHLWWVLDYGCCRYGCCFSVFTADETAIRQTANPARGGGINAAQRARRKGASRSSMKSTRMVIGSFCYLCPAFSSAQTGLFIVLHIIPQVLSAPLHNGVPLGLQFFFLGFCPARVFGVQLAARLQRPPIGRSVRGPLLARPGRDRHKRSPP